MKTKHSLLKKILFLGGIILCTTLLFSTVQAQTETNLQDIISAPQPRIKIPGLNFSSNETVINSLKQEDGPAGDGQYISIPYIGEYLGTIYRFAVVSTSIIAVIIIIIQGFVITTSAGNSSRMSHAKERIGQALTGLIIAAASYIILFTINPELVKFKNLKVLYIKRQDIQLSQFDSSDTFDGTPISVPDAKSKFNYTITQYKQFDGRWAEKPMECKPPFAGNLDIKSNGCGLVSSLIILNALYPDKKMDPIQFMDFYHSHSAGAGGSCNSSDYISPSYYKTEWMQERYPGLNVRLSRTQGNATAMTEELNKGNLIIVLVGASALTKGGHYIVVYDVSEKDGRYWAHVSDAGAGQPKCVVDLDGKNLEKDHEIKLKIKSNQCGSGSQLERCKTCGGTTLMGPDVYPLSYVLQAEKGSRIIFEPPKK